MAEQLLYLDCSAGISGDMTVAALLDLGADETVLREALSSLPLDGYRIEITRVKKSGIDACDFHVILDEAHENRDHDMEYLHGIPSPAGHSHAEHSHEMHSHAEHSHEHHHHGRGMEEITTILYSGLLSDRALALALRIFEIVAEAESRVHAVPVEQVHFHEVGAVDSIVDIAAVAVCIDNLGIEQVVIPSLTEGTGQIRCQHGLLPVPVPAVAAIAAANHLPLHILPVSGELVTPTGAAIAAALRTKDALPETFSIQRIGMGAGKRSYETSGILRAMLLEELPGTGKPAASAKAYAAGESEGTGEDCERTGVRAEGPDPAILKLETNLDDCSPEALGFVMDLLFQAGALDVYFTPVYMKKNRPGILLSVLCRDTIKDREAMERIIFRHTTGIGIRRQRMERTRLPREKVSVSTPVGEADVKVCTYQGEVYCYPEHESVARLSLANDLGYKEMYQLVKMYAMRSLLDRDPQA